MSTCVFEVKLKDGRAFRIFCANQSQKNRFFVKLNSIMDLVDEYYVISNGIHTTTQWESIVETI